MNTNKKAKLLFLGILGLFISCSNSELTTKEVEETILGLEREALDEWSKGNPSGFHKYFAEDATYFDDIAAQDRRSGIEEIKTYFQSLKGKIPPHNYEIVEPKFQIYKDIVILTLRYESKNENNEPGQPWKATSVYRSKDDQWQVVHANWSLVK
jgi:hypothetical protein